MNMSMQTYVFIFLLLFFFFFHYFITIFYWWLIFFLGIGQNRKLGNLGNFRVYSKSYLNLLVFVLFHFSGVVTTSVKIRGKQNFRDFRVFDLGHRAKLKTRKVRKFFFFLLNYIGTFQFFAQIIFLPLLNLELLLLSEFERRDIFSRFPSF